MVKFCELYVSMGCMPRMATDVLVAVGRALAREEIGNQLSVECVLFPFPPSPGKHPLTLEALNS